MFLPKYYIFVVFIACLSACSADKFSGKSAQRATDQQSEGSDTTTYIPVGGSQKLDLPPGTCNVADSKIASCSDGSDGSHAVVGSQIGKTEVSVGGKTATVVVYDPKNPPPGVTGETTASAIPNTQGPNTQVPNPQDTLIEDGGELSIPGKKVARVGINFEDATRPQYIDFNDSVMCFTGKFKVNGQTITSYAKQDVHVDVYNASACQHTLTISVINPDGTKTPVTQTDTFHSTVSLTLHFEIKSTLEVSMQITGKNADYCSEKDVKPFNTDLSMTTDAQVLADVCNTTGG